MDKKESDGKVYRVYKSRDSHVNTKVNENGRKAAIQFGDKNNLDESSYRILSAFSKGNLIVGDKIVPITQYIDYSK